MKAAPPGKKQVSVSTGPSTRKEVAQDGGSLAGTHSHHGTLIRSFSLALIVIIALSSGHSPWFPHYLLAFIVILKGIAKLQISSELPIQQKTETGSVDKNLTAGARWGKYFRAFCGKALYPAPPPPPPGPPAC